MVSKRLADCLSEVRAALVKAEEVAEADAREERAAHDKLLKEKEEAEKEKAEAREAQAAADAEVKQFEDSLNKTEIKLDKQKKELTRLEDLLDCLWDRVILAESAAAQANKESKSHGDSKRQGSVEFANSDSNLLMLCDADAPEWPLSNCSLLGDKCELLAVARPAARTALDVFTKGHMSAHLSEQLRGRTELTNQWDGYEWELEHGSDAEQWTFKSERWRHENFASHVSSVGEQWLASRKALLLEELQGLCNESLLVRHRRLRALQLELHPVWQLPEFRARAQELYLLLQNEWKAVAHALASALGQADEHEKPWQAQEHRQDTADLYSCTSEGQRQPEVLRQKGGFCPSSRSRGQSSQARKSRKQKPREAKESEEGQVSDRAEGAKKAEVSQDNEPVLLHRHASNGKQDTSGHSSLTMPILQIRWWSTWDEIFAELDSDEDSFVDGVHQERPARSLTDSRVDVLIMGATGVVGTLACMEMQKQYSRTWAIAGRDGLKLKRMKEKFGRGSFFCGSSVVKTADHLKALAKTARVVIDFRGPMHQVDLEFGEACLHAGTHYLVNSADVFFAKALREKVSTEPTAKGLVFASGLGANQILTDFAVWNLVRHLRHRSDLQIQRVDKYEISIGQIPGGTMVATGLARNHEETSKLIEEGGGPFFLGGMRTCGIRDQERNEADTYQDPHFGLWAVRGENYEKYYVRCSCGMFDSTQPYGDKFLFKSHATFKAKEEADLKLFSDEYVRRYYHSMLEEGKMPPTGTGSSKLLRQECCRTIVTVAETEELQGKDVQKAHSILQVGPGGLADMSEGSAMTALQCAICLLDALDAGLKTRSGWGTPTWHFAHLEYFDRLRAKGITYRILDGAPQSDLLDNLEQSVAEGAAAEERSNESANEKYKLVAECKPSIPDQPWESGRVWAVVGGVGKGGIIVRREWDLKSTAFDVKLTPGTQIEEMELRGNRLHYKRIRGDGPDFGWVTIEQNGKHLVELYDEVAACEEGGHWKQAPPSLGIRMWWAQGI